jgi:omega-6 fatty acid desaturase (delta-12 desaturase)
METAAPAAPPHTTLAAVIERLPADCYDNPTWRGVLWLLRDALVYAAVVAALVYVDHPLLLVPLWLLAGLAVSALFILGHDAAHGALFKSERLSYLLGQLAMLPSFHLYEAWVLGHNRIHHGHTTREVMDYVWHPLTPEQYRALTPLGRLAHRVKWSWLGAGVYYMHEIWWSKMIRFQAGEKLAAPIRRDRLVVGAYALLVSAAALGGGYAAYGSPGGALWMWVKVLGVPFVVWNYTIGWAVYVHHIAPDILWHRRRDWNKFKGQMEGTTILYMPAWLNFFMHNIFLHVAHHVDMRIPFYRLPLATRIIVENFGDVVRERRYRFSDYLAATRSCKLFDFEHHRWCTYEAAAAADARSPAAA